MVQLKRRQSSKKQYAEGETPEAVFIPYHCHWDANTILTKNRELLQIVKVEGYAFETADDEDIDMKKAVRNSLLKSVASGNFALWFHTVRRRHSRYPEGKMPPGFSTYLDEQWREKNESKDSYTNDLYITIIRKADTKGAAKIEHIVKALMETADKESRDVSMVESFKELKDTTYRIMATLRDYGPRLLGTIETNEGVFSEPLEFLGRLVNGGFSQPMLLPSMDIAQYLATHRLYFGKSAIEIRGPTKRRFASIIAIKEYPNATAAGMLDAFLQLPFEFIISQSYTYINRQTALEKMQLHQRRMMQSEDAAVSQVAEISNALDMAMSGHVAFGSHHMSILVLEDDLKSLEEAESMVLAELVNVGINAVKENWVLEASYWAQLPANFEYIGRKADLNSLNIAGLNSLHNYPVGQLKGNHWGNAVTVLDTSSGTPYYFNFHSRDVGHTTIIGPTGGGKTVLMNFLCAQAQKFNSRMFFFDKDRGAEIFIRALRGEYTIIHPGTLCNFNPLQLPDTPENRSFLGDWFRALLGIHGEQVSTEDNALINQAINGNYKLDKSDRKLSSVAPFFGIETSGSAASRLKMWYGSGQYAGLFDNPYDALDFDSATVFGFEMGEVLADKTSLGPVLLYLFHRISMSLDGTPTMIVLDEAWALIDNEVFAPRIKDWLKTLRKLNAMVIFATQSVEDATKSNISDTLVQQTATQIFLPNNKATAAYRDAFMLSEREFNLLKTTPSSSHFFLLKQSSDVVVARLDLGGMEDIINILSGRAETVAILDKVRAEVGDDPDDWIPVFQERLEQRAAE